MYVYVRKRERESTGVDRYRVDRIITEVGGMVPQECIGIIKSTPPFTNLEKQLTYISNGIY